MKSTKQAATPSSNGEEVRGALQPEVLHSENGHVTYVTSETLSVILAGLQTMRDGDFSVRLPGDWTGLAGKVADTFNDIVTANHQISRELKRVGQAVGKEGRTRERMRFHLEKASWGEMEVSVNTLVDDLLRPTTEVTRAIAAVAKGNSELLEQLSREIRTISHLLHPPLLDEVGLLPAIRTYAEGFAERSNVKVSVELSPDLGRLSPTVEISIFRIIQECLTNVYRHSGSKTAEIKIWTSQDNLLTVQIRDEGKGMSVENHHNGSSAKKPGVGLRGMRERVRELGGNLEIQSNDKGTTVIAALPLVGAVAVGA
jgi:signal transduction histidine kinase